MNNAVTQTLQDVQNKIDALKRELDELLLMREKVMIIDSAIFEDDRYKKFDYGELGYKSSDYFDGKGFANDVELLQAKINYFETIRRSIEKIHKIS